MSVSSPTKEQPPTANGDAFQTPQKPHQREERPPAATATPGTKPTTNPEDDLDGPPKGIRPPLDKQDAEPIGKDEDGPIYVDIPPVESDDPEVINLGKVRKYQRVGPMNDCAIALNVFAIVACIAIGIGLGNADWYAAELGSQSTSGSTTTYNWGLLRTCVNNTNCELRMAHEEVTTYSWSSTSSCTLSASDMQMRFGILWALGAVHAIVACLVAIFALFINCRPTSSGKVLAVGIISILGALCGAGCLAFFTWTMGKWYFCGDVQFCETTSVAPCTNEVSHGTYIYCVGIACSFIAGVIAIVIRALHAGAKKAAKAEVVADRELDEVAKIKSTRAGVRLKKKERARLARIAEQQKMAAAQQNAHEPLIAEEAEQAPTSHVQEPVSEPYYDEPAQPYEEEEEEEEVEEELIRPDFEIAGAKDWVFDERSRFYYSHNLNMFWDAATQKYFDVETNVWKATPNTYESESGVYTT